MTYAAGDEKVGTVIFVGGEALVDLVPAPGTGPGELGLLQPLLGGGPYNVAVTLGRLGAPVRFLSKLSTDAFGDALLARLRMSGVDTSLIQRGPEPTTLAAIGLGPDGSAKYSFYVEGTADRMVADPGELDVDIVSLGTNSLSLEPGASAYEAVLRRHARQGRLTVVDPNIRPDLMPDSHRARFESWLPDIGLLKLSVEDVAWLSGSADPEAAIRRWLTQGPVAAVMTRGADGLVVLTATGRRLEVPTVPAAVVDTIGAGDTVHGALLYWLHTAGVSTPSGLSQVTDGEWRDALTFAARAAAVTVSRAGAEPPYAAELAIHP